MKVCSTIDIVPVRWKTGPLNLDLIEAEYLQNDNTNENGLFAEYFDNKLLEGTPRTRVDEIVDFAEVEKFLDTPVKRYSSGMYVRLAFAVAAHLEPEILVVDEVLAVGDIAFQKKCLGKMEDVGKAGRTVLFVSHNMAT